MSDSANPWTTSHQDSLFFTVSWSLLKLMSIESMMPSNHLILLLFPFLSCLQSFPALGSFPTSRLFTSGGQSFGAWATATVLPVNIQGRFLLRLRVWFPCSPEDSEESSQAPPLESINSLAFSLLYGPTLTSAHDYWKNHSSDYSFHILHWFKHKLFQFCFCNF